MSHELRHGDRSERDRGLARPDGRLVPGKRTLAEALPAADAAVQRKAVGAELESEHVHTSARRGIATASAPLPFGDRIQRLFGRHDISGIRAHVGADASASARAMGAAAYATGDHVVLGDGADLHTVAHEAAHVVQQRGGVQLKGGVGAAGDPYERHADAVADLVVQGVSAEPLLDHHARVGGGSATTEGAAAVQRKVGFELELAIPISPKGPGDTDGGNASPEQDARNASVTIPQPGTVLAFNKKTDPFHLQNDLGYSRIGNDKEGEGKEIGASILEVVTAPIDEYAVDVETQLTTKVGGAIAYVGEVMASDPRNQRTSLPGSGGQYMVGYPKLAEGAADKFARNKLSTAAFMQVNIGILPAALTEFHELVGKDHTKAAHKQEQIGSAIKHARAAADLAMSSVPDGDGADGAARAVRDEVTGFLVLLIDLLIGGKTVPLNHDKNIVPVLSKTDLQKLRCQALSRGAQAVLESGAIIKYLVDAELLPKKTPIRPDRLENSHYLFEHFGPYKGKKKQALKPADKKILADYGNPLKQDLVDNALTKPPSAVGDGFTLKTLEDSAIEPDELGPLEHRASNQPVQEGSAAPMPSPLGAVLEVRDHPGHHEPSTWLDIARSWLEIARTMNRKR